MHRRSSVPNEPAALRRLGCSRPGFHRISSLPSSPGAASDVPVVRALRRAPGDARLPKRGLHRWVGRSPGPRWPMAARRGGGKPFQSDRPPRGRRGRDDRPVSQQRADGQGELQTQAASWNCIGSIARVGLRCGGKAEDRLPGDLLVGGVSGGCRCDGAYRREYERIDGRLGGWSRRCGPRRFGRLTGVRDNRQHFVRSDDPERVIAVQIQRVHVGGEDGVYSLPDFARSRTGISFGSWQHAPDSETSANSLARPRQSATIRRWTGGASLNLGSARFLMSWLTRWRDGMTCRVPAVIHSQISEPCRGTVGPGSLR